MRFRPGALLLCSAAVLGLCLAPALTACAHAQGHAGRASAPMHGDPTGPILPPEDLTRLGEMAADSARAADAITELRAFLGRGPEGMYRQWALNNLLLAQLRRHAPVGDVIAAAESLATTLPPDYQRRVGFYSGLAEVLADLPDGVTPGLGYARKALDEVPPTPDAMPALSVAQTSQALLMMRSGDPRGAIALLTEALPNAPDSLRVLVRLGRAHEQAQLDDAAIGYYVRAMAAFPGGDSTALEPLRNAWTRRHGSLKGLDQRVSTQRTAALKRVALDQRRDERAAPDFALPSLDDTTRTVTLGSFKGKVLLVDFWGSWCGPCRMEMPLFQALAEKHKGRADVAFLGINWERQGNAAQRREAANAFLKENNLTFPNVYDLAGSAAKDFGVEGFPTVFVVDRAGKVRYANRGYGPGIDEILETQLLSLLGK